MGAMRVPVQLLIAALLLNLATPALSLGQGTMSQIKSDERVVFFPTAARLSDDGESWIVPIHGWIFEPEEVDWWRTPLVSELRQTVDLVESDASAALFEKRFRTFLVDNERGKRIRIRIAGKEHVLPESSPNGHFRDEVRLPVESVKLLAGNDKITFHAVTADGDERKFVGMAYCLEPEGISVISDIDDTIKVSNVLNKKELLRNTFVREYEAVDGMSTVYQKWAADGANFHYVSASPWQLYEPLSELIEAANFPGGTFHLKSFRVKDSTALDLFAHPTELKTEIIESLFERFPKRTYILVGDSGEKDPEIYGAIARKHPQQVRQIYIREVTNVPADADRYEEAFDDVPPDVWHVFTDPKTLPSHASLGETRLP
jgi:phosphatidate phosphatase APP1